MKKGLKETVYTIQLEKIVKIFFYKHITARERGVTLKERKI
jgi:hypothetical protein